METPYKILHKKRILIGVNFLEFLCWRASLEPINCPSCGKHVQPSKGYRCPECNSFLHPDPIKCKEAELADQFRLSFKDLAQHSDLFPSNLTIPSDEDLEALPLESLIDEFHRSPTDRIDFLKMSYVKEFNHL